MYLILNNNIELELMRVPIISNNGERDTIKFIFEPSKYSFDYLYKLFNDFDNTQSFILKDVQTDEESGELTETSYTHEYFCILEKAFIEKITMPSAEDEAFGTEKQAITFILGKLNYNEIQQKKLIADIQYLKESNISIMEAITEIYES